MIPFPTMLVLHIIGNDYINDKDTKTCKIVMNNLIFFCGVVFYRLIYLAR